MLATFLADAVGAAELMRAGVADVVPWPIAADETIAALRDSLRRSGASRSIIIGGSPQRSALSLPVMTGTLPKGTAVRMAGSPCPLRATAPG